MVILTHGQAFDLLRRGATLVTASQRLALVLSRAFDAASRKQGSGAWALPDILHWSAWIERCFQTLAARSFDYGQLPPIFLKAEQESLVWERVVAATHGERLLDTRGTAAEARKAWSLLQEWKPVINPDEWESTADTAAFRDWTREYNRELTRNNWTDRTLVPERLLREEPGWWCDPARLHLFAGFDDITPRQRAIIDALRRSGGEAWEVRVESEHRMHRQARLLGVGDTREELLHAAAWARALVEDGRAEQAVIAVPGLAAQTRPRVERALVEVLSNEQFNISAGRPLATYPIIRAALLALDWARGTTPFDAVSAMLRSPFFGAAERELEQRARCELALRKAGGMELSVVHAAVRAELCPDFADGLRAFERLRLTLPHAETAPGWARRFSELLRAIRWPGERARTSAEYQTLARWTALLGRFAALDIVAGRMRLDEALARLGSMAADDEYQPESGQAPVQVLGLLETSGLEFEHLWVTGLTDDVWPRPPAPNPFLPASAQRRHDMPNSSAAREFDFARRETWRILESTVNLTFSYAKREADRELFPSRLLAEVEEVPSEPLQFAGAAAAMYARAPRLEGLADNSAPPISGAMKGGTYLLQAYSACPFQAFARFRLRAEAIEPMCLGLSPMARGSLIHGVLSRVWTELKDSDGLRGERVAEVVRESVAQALGEADAKTLALTPALQALEQERLERLVCDWLEFEKSRGVFRVMATEEKRIASYGGLELTFKLDRVDELSDGSHVILDYKSGELKANAWVGERPEEPQLPLYATSHPAPVAAVAFAGVKTGDLRFRGIAARPGVLPDVESSPDLPVQVEEWRRVLEELARGFAKGNAAVDPKSGRSCDRCTLASLCRVGEAPLG